MINRNIKICFWKSLNFFFIFASIIPGTVLQRSILHIIFSSMLVCNLLFSQVVIHFFHYHEGEDSYSLKKSKCSSSAIKKSVSKCKVCSLHIFHDLFYYKETPFEFISLSESIDNVLKTESYNYSLLCTKGRAPPIFSSLF